MYSMPTEMQVFKGNDLNIVLYQPEEGLPKHPSQSYFNHSAVQLLILH